MGIPRTSTFASAFRKEQRIRAIFDTISYRQVVRRAYLNKVCPRVIRTVNQKDNFDSQETDLSKKRQTGTSMDAACFVHVFLWAYFKYGKIYKEEFDPGSG